MSQQQEKTALSWADAWRESNGSEPPLAVLIDMLRQPVAPQHVEQVKGADYVAIEHIRDYLDDRLGAERWEWVVTSQGCMTGAPYFVVSGNMTIHGGDRSCTKSGGDAEGLWDHQPYQDKQGGPWKTKAYGNPYTNAEAGAIRRAAMAFRFCRELWGGKPAGV